MVNYMLKITAEVENVKSLQPMGGCDDPNFTFYFKLRCENCGEMTPKETAVSLEEEVPLPKSRGHAHLLQKSSGPNVVWVVYYGVNHAWILPLPVPAAGVVVHCRSGRTEIITNWAWPSGFWCAGGLRVELKEESVCVCEYACISTRLEVVVSRINTFSLICGRRACITRKQSIWRPNFTEAALTATPITLTHPVSSIPEAVATRVNLSADRSRCPHTKLCNNPLLSSVHLHMLG
ncbi:hypothetical protein Cgig2_011488 [Carnegiea gigantea]|uniref:Uncharacterized protein n=1 Tax=Carnegiea gigantea TaxID=171969 RepID=A0A9Q1KSZ7_9CARY|nr:hypothetical protein Cgig2_011488 [Carnegiea gigantea]